MPDWFRPIQFTRGDDCLNCYAAGLTPLHYYVSFVGIMRGALWIAADGQPPNGLYDMTQTVAKACRWQVKYNGGGYVRYDTDPAQSELEFITDIPTSAFQSTILHACRRWHFNEWNAPAGKKFYGGYGIVFTPMEIQAIIETVTPVVDPDPLFRVSPVADEKLVISYIDEWGDTKIKMLVDNPL